MGEAKAIQLRPIARAEADAVVKRVHYSGKIVPNSFVIGWEYSTNDDFQDVVCHIDNVTLVDEPALAP